MIYSIKFSVLDCKHIFNHVQDVAILFHMTKLLSDIFYPQEREVEFYLDITKYFIKFILIMVWPFLVFNMIIYIARIDQFCKALESLGSIAL